MSKSFFRILTLCLFLNTCLTACGQNNRKAVTDAESGGREAASTSIQAEKLTREIFEKKVADLSAPDWKFLGDKPCVIDFYADWCGPCKQLSPILDKALSQFGDKVLLYKINVDEERELAAAFGVQSIPMLLFIPMEAQPRISVGLVDETFIVSTVKQVIFAGPSDKTE